MPRGSRLYREVAGAQGARLLAAALAACALSFAAQARPRTCLVLSGGGARGAAHIGVLKVLEEMRVPVDCIAGTSMGSIVGGAYASGMSVADMEKALGSITSNGLFVENPPRQDLTMRRKQDDRSILFGPEIGLDSGTGKLGLPKGLVSGIQLESVLRGLVRTPGFVSFDALPIPFRAVATDLETGTAFVISEGDVAQAMRASMSVPGAIAPAERGTHILVDGGLTDNLPVDVARAMGAEIVIAVNLGTPLMRRDQLGSAFGVTSQMINILTEQNVRASLASLKPTDVLIEPKLGNFSASDFDDLMRTVPIGEAAAREVAPRLAALSLPAPEYAALQASRTAPAPTALVVDEVRFAPMARVNPEILRGSMESKAGAPVEPQMIDRDLRRMYGTGDFERVGYSVLDEHGQRVLLVQAVEKAWGPDYLRLGLGLGSDFKGDNFFNVAASYRKTWLNPLGAEWRSDAEIGNTSLIATEFYQPAFVSRALFVAPRAEALRRTQDLYDDTQRIARYNVRSALAGIDIGSEFGRFGEVRVGAVAGNVHATEETGPPQLAPRAGRIQQGALTARFELDQLDSANFPRSGYAARVSFYDSLPSLGADVSYKRWDAEANAAVAFGRHAVQFALKGGGPVGSDPLPSYDQMIWGGFLQQSGYPRGALTGQRLEFGRVVYNYRLAQQRLFEGAYAGFSLEAGHLGGPLVPTGAAGTIKSAAAFIAVDTPLGPLYLGYGRASGGASAAYFYLGRP